MKNKKALASVFLALTMMTMTGCERVPTPTVREGKFDFSVTYEVDGEQETVSGVVVCEFVEVVRALDGAYLEWNWYVEDSQLANQLEQTRGYLLLKTCEDGEIYLDFDFSARYFMADPSFVDLNENTDEPVTDISPRLFMEYSEAKGEELGEWYSEDVAVLESYGTKIISYEYDAPIENIYK